MLRQEHIGHLRYLVLAKHKLNGRPFDIGF